jgi:hypothetical protein
MRKIDNQGQMQMLEVILVSGMLLLALFFVKTIEISAISSVEKENKLEALGISILDSLSGEADPSEEYSSILARYISSGSYYDDFSDYVYEVLPDGTIFRIIKIDMTNFVHDADATPEGCTYTIYDPPYWVDEEARASRIVVADGIVYEVILMMWFNAGG